MPANSDVSRRSVLKRAAGVVAGGGAVLGASGVGAARPTPDVAVVRTAKYDTEYGNPDSTVYAVSDFCFNNWQEYLDGAAYTNTPSLTIPEDELRIGYSLSARATEVDQWLRGELREQDRDSEHYLYDQYDAFLVLDYLTDSEVTANAPGNSAGIGTAGDTEDKTAVINAWYEDANELGIRSNIGIEGVAFHEMSHLFNAIHDEGEVMGSRGSIMATKRGAAPSCGYGNDQEDIEELGPWLSPCNIGRINDYTEGRF